MKILSSLIKAVDEFSKTLEKPGDYWPVTSTNGTARDTIIITDVSCSMEDNDFKPTRLGGAIEAGIEYINSRDNPDDRASVISFSTEAKIVLPLTNITEKGKIVETIRSLKIDGGTDINKGLKAAVDIFSNETRRAGRYVILLTDGYGGRSLKTALKLKEQLNTVIEVVGIGGTPEAVNESLLRKVATTDLNGFTHYRFIKNSVDLKKHYKNLAAALEWKGR